MPLRLRRGTDSERQSITPLDGELIWTTDTKRLFAGDGITAGGLQVTGAIPESIGDLDDVDITSLSPTFGQVLKWNGVAFVPGDDEQNTEGMGVIEGNNYRLNIIADDSQMMIDTANFASYADIWDPSAPTKIIDTTVRSAKIDIVSDGDVTILDHNTGTLSNFLGEIVVDIDNGAFIGDVDGSMRGSVYNTTLTTALVDHINEEFNGTLNGNVVGDVSGSVFADDSTLLVNGIEGTVTGTVTGKIETSESIVTDKFSDSGAGFGQDIVLKIYGGTEANKDEPNNFARAGIFMEAYDPLSSDYVKDSLVQSYHLTGGGSLLALSPTNAAGTFFETALELDGVAGTSTTRATNNIVLTSKNVSLVTSNIPASSVGQAGDTTGMVAVDTTSIYYCIADYTDGLSDIWVKQDWGTTGSW